MSQSLLADALAAGASIVTPNNRLAREIVLRFDEAQRQGGARTWSAADALPWTLWLERLWREALAARVQEEPPILLSRGAVRELWHSIVVRHGGDLLNAGGAARHAADAWTTFHAWRDASERLDGWSAHGTNEDQAVFAQWAARFRTRLASLHAVDAAELPDVLTQFARPGWLRETRRVLLHGFIALTPQQQRLVETLRAAGVDIAQSPAVVATPTRGGRSGFATPRAEVAHALGFARARLQADPGARIAIVVADLEQRREEIVALADEILCPERLLTLETHAPRPYGISLGEPLSSVPVISCALDLITLAYASVDAGVASSIVRAPFLPDAASRWTGRAGVERHWRSLGLREVGWRDVVLALREFDAALHQRFASLALPSRGARTPREWARGWSDWLTALGWPGNATLTSAQWQAREAFSSALAQFAATGTITGRCAAASALETLRMLLAETLFQPEAPPAQIQILGILEAAGLTFDCAWLAGFDAERWPGPVAPNPFLSLAWQRVRGVPRANPDIVLAQARRVTAVLMAIAPDIVVSHARTIDDAPARVSPLFADWEPLDPATIAGTGRFADSMLATRERWSDHVAPALPPGARVRGGAALFESQSACPFQAFARHRLAARAWDECPLGLSATERGTILHEMLRAFWDAVGDQGTLLALDPASLDDHVHGAVEAGKAKLGAPRWRALPPAVERAEAVRLAATLRAWIEYGERRRPPFRVRAHEVRIDCEIGGIALDVRIDRVDALAAGGLAVIDYKSGRVVRPARWFGERAEGLQLAVYANAIDRTSTEPIRALAFAQVRAGDVAVAGLAEAADVWPTLETPEALTRFGVADWPHAREALRERLRALADELRSGLATVSPRDRATCRRCGLQSLCRIQRLGDEDDEARLSGDE